MRLTDLLALSHVPRWSIVRHVIPQSVADHSFRMTVIALELAHRLGVPTHAEFILACLYHDGPESRTGDIPSSAKRLILNGGSDSGFVDWNPYPQPGQLLEDQLVVLALADKIEGYTFIQSAGIGEHAGAVVGACKAELHRLIPEKWAGVVWGVITDIEAERGRANWG